MFRSCRKLGQHMGLRQILIVLLFVSCSAGNSLLEVCTETEKPLAPSNLNAAVLIKGLLLDSFARKDGFDAWELMLEFFDKQYGLPFEAVLITW